MSRDLYTWIRTTLLGLGLLASMHSAGAAGLTWTFAGVQFDDGGSLSGSFDFDADTGSYSNISISVAGGNATFFPDFTYTDGNSTVLATSGLLSLSLVVSFSVSDSRSLFVHFAGSLTNAGGTIDVLNAIGLGGDSEFRTLSSSPPFGQRGSLAGGTIHAVPEPASALFMLAWRLERLR